MQTPRQASELATVFVMSRPWRIVLRRASVWVLLASSGFNLLAQTPTRVEPGLAITYATSSDQTQTADYATSPNVWLYVPAGNSPTPFLPGGKFTAVWKGLLSVDLRSDYAFQAELNGDLKLEINGAVVLEATGNGNQTELSKLVRLNKGTNALTATFRSPARGDAFVRLDWFNKEAPRGPIPLSALTHLAASTELQRAEKLRLGRELFVEHRCQKCHIVPGSNSGMPELTMDAPSFDGIGSRRNYEWMTRWILDPKTQRPTAHMPKVLHGTNAKAEAVAIAAFLAAQKDDSPPNEDKQSTDEQKEAGKRLFETLHCVACHNAPDGNEADPRKIPLKHVRGKFTAASLPAFLLKPEAHYAWTRMPNFKLKPEEAGQLAAFLNSVADKPTESSAPADAEGIERGKKLVQTSGCLNCHPAKLENQFSTKPLAELSPDKWKQGCLAETSTDSTKSPQFAFGADEREALQTFGATDRASLTRHVPPEFAERQSHLLNCRECHGKFDGFPPFEILGEKLKPAWTARFIAGEIAYKPRPWLDSRMPAFGKRAEQLSQGLAMQHGYPPHTPDEPSVDMEAAKQGQKLTSAAGGFSCVLCHAVGEMGATQIAEAPGINFAHSGERLLKPFFQRWLRNPLQIDPATKMPVYFDENGKSPLPDFYEGDGPKTINAIWEYLRLGEKMSPPPTP